MVIKTELNLAELRNFAKNLPKMKEKVLDLMEIDVKSYAKSILDGLLGAEIALFLGREKYERKNLVQIGQRNYRNGSYGRRFFIKGLGGILVKVPRDRLAKFKSQVLPRYARIDERVKQDCALMYLMGMSTRAVSLISERLFGRKLSHAEISTVSLELSAKVEAWRTRPITEKIKYLYVDGTNFAMRVAQKVEKVCVLVVIGVTENNHKQVLALQAGDKESATAWRELFKDLKARGLDRNLIELGVMDGLSGLENVFKEEFPNSNIQRCQVHLARNVITKVPCSLRKQVGDDLRSIFYASSRKKAMEFYKSFETKWSKEIPSAFKCLERNLTNALTFFKFPEEEWLSIRTTNAIERLNKEFKRRTKPMEVVAGEASCYNLLAVIAIRMEAHWKKNPIHFQRSLPWFKSPQENLHN